MSLLDMWGGCNTAKSHPTMKCITFLNHCPTGILNVDTLSNIIGLPCEKILDMSFYNLLKKFECSSKISYSMIMVGLLHREYHYCPVCLSEHPHHELLWSINKIEICIKHNMQLRDRCIHCKQVIKLKDVTDFQYCPYCGGSLKDTREKAEEFSPDYYNNQKWLIDNFIYLLTRSNVYLSRKDLAVGLLYILNGLKPKFVKCQVSEFIENHVNVSMLLEHAHDTLSRKKNFNLAAALKILYITNSSFEQLFTMQVPQEFYNSLHSFKIKSYTCCAPWCSYRERLKKSSDSCDKSKIRFHLTCYECGCRYGIDIDDKLVERSYFIDLYTLLSTIKENTISIKEQSKAWGYPIGKTLRAIAYFDSRGVFRFDNYHIEFDEIKLLSFLAAYESGKPLNDIRFSGQWNSFYEYLYYRYHDKVLKLELAKQNNNKLAIS